MVPVEWPESQNYMNENWFEEEAELINSEPLLSIYGVSAYLIPRERLIEVDERREREEAEKEDTGTLSDHWLDEADRKYEERRDNQIDNIIEEKQ